MGPGSLLMAGAGALTKKKVAKMSMSEKKDGQNVNDKCLSGRFLYKMEGDKTRGLLSK